MIPAMLGKKIGMTQVFDDEGVLHPVTVVEAKPCTVLQIKSDQRDGYNAKHVSLGENVGEAVKEVRALVVMPISQMTDDDALEMEDLNAALYEYLN